MVSTLKIELNGTLITGRIDGTENFVITYRRKDEEGSLSASYSSELTFYDDGYDILKTILIDDVNGFDKRVDVKIYDDCCGKIVFEGAISGDSIDWCSDGCYISANVIENDEQLNCVKSTLIYNNENGFLSQDHPIIRYCIEIRPEFIHYFLIFVSAFLTTTVSNLLLPLIAFLSIFAPGLADEIRDLRDQIRTLAIQCGRYHPSAYVRDYIKNVCQKCGLTFQSSILNGDNSSNYPWGDIYFNTVLMSAPVKKGRDKDDTNRKLISNNLPIETLDTLMKKYLEPMFNAEYRIVNGILIFERKDYFQTNNEWINANDLLVNGKLEDDKICWSWIDKERFALGEFKYAMEPIDYCANEALDRWNDIVEWNPPPINPSQKGIKQVYLGSSCARFREDGIDTSVYDFMKNALGGLINIIIGSGAFSSYREVMLIPQHTFFNYKFLIYDPRQGTNGMVKHDYDNTFCGGNPGMGQNERFNYPYWFLEGKQGVSGYQNNLYSLFHYVDNPREPSAERYNFNFTFDFECDSFDTFSFDKTVGGLNLNGTIVQGKINEIVVNFTNRTIKVTGIV